MSSTPHHVGQIIHCNDEVSHKLGYHPKELIGKNVSVIMPLPIANCHGSFLQDYFESAKSRGVLNKVSKLFGATFEGYLQAFSILVRVYPSLNERIVFVGFVQKLDKYDH